MAEAPKNKSYILIAILAVIWGSSFILIKKGIDVYTPFQVGAIRIFVAAIALFPFIFRSFGNISQLRDFWEMVFRQFSFLLLKQI